MTVSPRARGVESSVMRPLRVLERNAVIGRHYWQVQVARFFEPFLFLFAVGVGVGSLVGEIPGPGGVDIPYRSFLAPALVATSAMNAGIFAGAFDVFAKTRWVRSYHSMLATPLTPDDVLRGELLWTLGYVALRSATFVITMWVLGIVESWWAVFVVPTGVLVAFAFTSVGFVVASVLRTWLDFDYVSLAIVPLFLFSASFFPLDSYPGPVAVVVQLTPLYHGVDLARDLTLGHVDWWSLISVLYLVVLGSVALRLAGRRIGRVLQP